MLARLWIDLSCQDITDFKLCAWPVVERDVVWQLVLEQQRLPDNFSKFTKNDLHRDKYGGDDWTTLTSVCLWKLFRFIITQIDFRLHCQRVPEIIILRDIHLQGQVVPDEVAWVIQPVIRQRVRQKRIKRLLTNWFFTITVTAEFAINKITLATETRHTKMGHNFRIVSRRKKEVLQI